MQTHCGLTCCGNSTALLVQPSTGHCHCWYNQASETCTVAIAKRRTLALLISQAPDTCVVDTAKRRTLTLLIEPSAGHLHCWYSQAPGTCIVDRTKRRTLALLIEPSAGHLHCWYSPAPDTCTVNPATVHTAQSAKCEKKTFRVSLKAQLISATSLIPARGCWWPKQSNFPSDLLIDLYFKRSFEKKRLSFWNGQDN